MLTWHFFIILMITSGQQCMPFASCAISVSDVTAETKMEAFSRIGTKSGKNKILGLKWKSLKNVGTKIGFSP